MLTRRALRAFSMFGGSLLAGLALAALAGCGPDFDRPSVVDSLRILAVRADPAAVLPGESTTLTALVADPLGGGRTVTYEWGACVSFDGAVPSILLASDCASQGVLPDPGEPASDGSLSVTLPPRGPGKNDDPWDQLTSVEGLIGQSGSFAIPVRLKVTAFDEAGETIETQTAIVPVVVALEGTPNRNPEFDAIWEGGDPWPEGEARTVREAPPLELKATWPTKGPNRAAETYTYVATGSNDVVELKEIIAVSWYSSLGRLEPDVTSYDESGGDFFKAKLKLNPKKPSPADADPHLWIVISDGRGGVAWTERPLARP